MEIEEKKLAELIAVTGPINEAPKTIRLAGIWHEVVIGIGSDHTAYVRMREDDLRELCNRNGLDYEFVLTQNSPVSEGA